MELLHDRSLDAVIAIRAFYLICSCAIMLARLLPFLQKRFLLYGARAPPQLKQTSAESPFQSRTRLSVILNYMASMKVPHSWFTHFYLLSVAFSISWLLVVMRLHETFPSRTVIRLDIFSARRSQSQQSMTLCLLLLLLHGIRRLYECLAVMKPSNSPMWIGHYAFGLAFYLVTNVAVWIEGSIEADTDESLIQQYVATHLLLQAQIGIFLFMLASTVQHVAHRHLASLKKYSVPHGPLFNSLVAPHYTAECLIYFSIALVGAPTGQILNHTILCSVLLSVVNLGITAQGTKQWMLNKFREQATEISHRSCLIPGLW